ncbi:DUF4862 family protein [Bifidobacterium vansinderenii]|uniref:UDP-N-acetylglucosamine diphosphorylase n=1 Tax=Bifidobacterium vansinderenii TaxID=1984871 RepID=A0A229VYS5_9BIFI|nr:DUF4862 family protein [Bifidobacterium vansinderenii]OXN00774.1 UDP-N-acetylglucosamine diphosphorylase [Bifidobacterium vansinderenii]
MIQPTFVVGAYASLPQNRDDQRKYYDLLGDQPWVDATEIPYPGNIADPADRDWLADALPTLWCRNVITAIPGTMQTLGRNPNFGLASPDDAGRHAALDFFDSIREAISAMADRRGANDVAFVELHSAPTGHADADAMRRSLDELTGRDWFGTRLVIEHCDRFIDGQKPEKGFLPIESEIDICRQTGVGLTVNWGRSCVEGRDAGLSLEHVAAAAQAGVLTGLMFSGAGPEATQYGYEWIDGHLPMNPDEPTSLMDAERMRACMGVAMDCESLEYVGAKVCVPADSSLSERVGYLERIHHAVMAR